jgi:large subunit ribosomal protein L28
MRRTRTVPSSLFKNQQHFFNMSRICAVTGKRPVKGRRIIHKGQSKKSGGIGLQLVKQTKRVFRPNLQRIRVKLPSGQVKRQWVSVKAIKAGLVTKA